MGRSWLVYIQLLNLGTEANFNFVKSLNNNLYSTYILLDQRNVKYFHQLFFYQVFFLGV